MSLLATFGLALTTVITVFVKFSEIFGSWL